MIQFYLDHPIFGSGYGAYWDASLPVFDPSNKTAYLWKNVDQGHNGYLDLLVQVGIPGLALALYSAFVSPIRTLGTMIAISPQRAALSAALLTFALIENFSESYLFADDALGNAFLFVALAILHNTGLQQRRKSRIELPSPTQLRKRRQRRRADASD